MANNDSPFGLRPVNQFGGDYTGPTSLYYAPSTYSTDIFIGDPVTLTGTANTAVVRNNWDVGTLPEVNVTTVGDGNAISGVVVGIEPVDQEAAVYGAASTERVLHVVDDPNALFEIQADGAIAATQIGLNAVLIATHSGSTSTGLSGMELDTTSDAPAADTSNQLTILRQVHRTDNEPNLVHNKIMVRINNHTFNQGAVGV